MSRICHLGMLEEPPEIRPPLFTFEKSSEIRPEERRIGNL